MISLEPFSTQKIHRGQLQNTIFEQKKMSVGLFALRRRVTLPSPRL